MTRRFPVVFRLMCWLFGIVTLVAATGALTASLVNFEPALLIVPPSFAAGGVFFLRMARVRMVASDVGVYILNPIRSYQLSWGEVVDVVPTREGLALALSDGRVIVVWATCKSSLPGRIPVDEAAYEYLRARIRRALRRLAVDEGLSP